MEINMNAKCWFNYIGIVWREKGVSVNTIAWNAWAWI